MIGHAKPDLGVGIIGCGNISSAYLKLAPLFGGMEIRAVADIDMAAAQARADQFNVRAHSVTDLLAADDIDVVVNLTIPAVHYQVTRTILEAGKHAYSEKPLVLTLDEGEALRALAAQQGVRVGSAPDTFLGGAHQRARAIIDSGSVGRITGGTAHVMSRGMEHWHPNPDFFFQPGAGPMLDIGPYYVANLIQLIGPVARVTALTGSASPTRTIRSEPRNGEEIPVQTPTTIHAVLEFVSGAIVTLGASWDVMAHDHRNMELYGTRGSLYVPDPNFFGGDLVQLDDDGNDVPISPCSHVLGVPNQTHPQGDVANYRAAGLAEMVLAIQENREHRCSLELAIHVVDVLTACLQAGDERRVIELTTTCARPAPLNAASAAELMRT
jgi:predicted dehydrogenase